jgi:hypothetical protein
MRWILFFFCLSLCASSENQFVKGLEPNELLHTRLTLNYKVVVRYRDGKEFSRQILDVHTGQPVENPELISMENVVEERFEDRDNLSVIRMDLNGKILSEKAFKKSGKRTGRLILSDEEIEAILKYDVDDENLAVEKMDWDQIIFEDENFAKDSITRWSTTRDFMVKSEYTREGLIHLRSAWNRHTGARVVLSPQIYSQRVNKDIVQNHRGFMEIYYNLLGKVTAIRSWDRKTGKILKPPKSIPFASRLEKDHLKMNFEEHRIFRENYFMDSIHGKPVVIQEGQSLFKDKERDYQFLKSISYAGFSATDIHGKVGQNAGGSFRNIAPSAQRLRANWRPGKFPVHTDFLSTRFKARADGGFRMKDTLFGTGAEMDGRLMHLDAYVRRDLYARQDAQVDFLAGIRGNYHDLRFQDGSRLTAYSEFTAQPILGSELTWYPYTSGTLKLSVLATRFHLGGVATTSVRSGVEMRHKLPLSLSALIEGLDLALGYRRHDYSLRTDTDSLKEVGLESHFRGAYLEVQTRF